MIDSVIFHIEGIKTVHTRLKEFLHRRESQGFTRFKRLMDPVDVDDLQKRVYHHDYFTDHKDGHSFEVAYKGFIRSYHYEITYMIEFERDRINFNFSIPKYLYGTNVFQFVPHYFDKDHSEVRGLDFDQLADQTFARFFRFMDWFCKVELGGLVNYTMLRFTRIDMCYNKFFNSRDDALATLHDIKRVRKKFLRDTSRKQDNFSTGIYLVSTDYTFKIYHKGDEFRGHDQKELRQKSQFQKSDIEALTAMGDKMDIPR